MQTFQIATPRTLPEQVIEDMQFGFIIPEDIVDEFSHKNLSLLRFFNVQK